MTEKLQQAPGRLGPMNTPRSRAYRLFVCGCPREAVEVVKRETPSRFSAPVVIHSASHGDHDPRVPHALKVPCRAKREDTWPGRA